MDKQTIETFRQTLLELRKRLVGTYEKVVESSQEEFGGDLPDINDDATRTIQRRILLEFGDRQHDALTKVDDALERIDGGEYGACVDCGDDIPLKRLELIPYASYCVRCKERIEKDEKDNG